MHGIYELKDRLVEELEEYSKKELTPASLEKIDTLAHAAKNLAKIIECEEDDYSSRSRGYDDAMSYRGRSYARGRRRDGMGRYVSDGYSRADFADRVRELMRDAPDDHTRQEMERLASKL